MIVVCYSLLSIGSVFVCWILIWSNLICWAVDFVLFLWVPSTFTFCVEFSNLVFQARPIMTIVYYEIRIAKERTNERIRLHSYVFLRVMRSPLCFKLICNMHQQWYFCPSFHVARHVSLLNFIEFSSRQMVSVFSVVSCSKNFKRSVVVILRKSASQPLLKNEKTFSVFRK